MKSYSKYDLVYVEKYDRMASIREVEKVKNGYLLTIKIMDKDGNPNIITVLQTTVTVVSLLKGIGLGLKSLFQAVFGKKKNRQILIKENKHLKGINNT